MSSIQFDYSTLSTSISRSELSAIIGRHMVENSYDINEETSSERSSSSGEICVQPSPPDKYKLVFLTFGLLGIGTLLPWNFFITANDYWMYKFRDTSNGTCINLRNKTDLQAAFTSYLTISNNVPYVIFLILCMLYNNRFSKMLRVIAPLFIMFALFSIITAFVQIDTNNWEMGFFALTISLIIIVAVTSAILQSGVAAIASLLPSKYMHIMILGQVMMCECKVFIQTFLVRITGFIIILAQINLFGNTLNQFWFSSVSGGALAGIVASVAQILSLIGDCDSKKSAFIYFFSADTVILLTLIAYVSIQKSEFFKFHVFSLKDTTVLKDVSEPEVKPRISVSLVIKLVWPYALSILFDFWVTICIFPGLAVLSVPNSQEGLWNGKLYLPLACFFLFNMSDFCGRAVGGWLPMPSSWRMHLLTLCSLRVIFIPLFLLCNLEPRYHLPVIFHSDVYYIYFITLLGFTNGYFFAVAMVMGIKSVNPLLQEMAGVVLSAFLGAGLMLGAFSSYISIKII